MPTTTNVKIVIPGNCIAKKNSQMAISMGKRNMIIPSKAYQKWEKATKLHLAGQSPWGGSYPINIRFYHYRKTVARFDFSNMFEGVQDVLQAVGIIVEDDMDHVYPIIDGWEKDSDNPRVVITLEER